jgi:hypothetical protein
MSASHSTAPDSSGKPAKPYPGFPLFPHASRRWAKKIKGKMYYFGRWEDPDGALREFEAFSATGDWDRPGRQANPARPAKPSPDFPLFPHATGQWAKKIRGRMHYFGPWADADGALQKYLAEKDDLHAGRTPREDTEGLTVKELCNEFLRAKQAAVAALKETLAVRPVPKDSGHRGLVFITKYGLPWHRDTGSLGDRLATKEVRMVTVETYPKWQVDHRADDAAFRFVPPTEAKKVKSFR